MKQYIIMCSMLLLMAACTDPNDGSTFVVPTDIESEMRVTDILDKYSDEYSMWIDFLKYADFYNALCDANAVATIFCPTNDAVCEFLQWRGVNSIEELDKDYARAVVQTHIISEQKISETSIDNYAKDNTYIPSQNLFGGYLSLRFGRTLVDVDDEYKSDVVLSSDTIFINNQAKMERPTVRACANGSIYTLASVIRPMAETILGKLELEGEYDIFCQAIYATGLDTLANKMQ
ncbi:MAG: fasciclin domain-containing protein, partial [Prevotellaceae bacterium]|nr:fasciclin domain-containing protein [Prevotellaceae bacterium]